MNGHHYTIYDIKEISGKRTYVGRTNYENGEICIEEGELSNMLDTLRHELVHVWLYENGHTNQNKKEVFSYEDVCEIAALSSDFINKIVGLYLQNKAV